MWTPVSYTHLDVYKRQAQDRPLLLRPNQAPISLPGDGRFLGMLPDLELREEVVTLQPGDSLLLYSDGVTDAHNEADERYGLERLTRIFESVAGYGQATLDRLAQNVNAWRGQAAAFDDVTMLLVEAIAPSVGDE